MSTVTYEQTNRPIGVTTPLGADVLLLESFRAVEEISRPFRVELSLLAVAETTVAFDAILGQAVTVRLNTPGERADAKRFLHGIVHEFSQGGTVRAADGTLFVRYLAVVVPKLNLLRRQVRSRTFQHLTVIEILQQLLTGFTTSFETEGTFEPRDYCVQYNETDFAFASRLMEEEGLFYFFKHTDSDHSMVISNKAASHTDIEAPTTVNFVDFGGLRDQSLTEDRILNWRKTQELRSGKYTLWDYTFEKPDSNCEAVKTVLDSVAVGTVTHKLAVASNSAWEIYEYPGGFAGRFDGIDKGGGEQAAEIQKIFQDNTRTVGLRMQQETIPAVVIHAESNVRRLQCGCKFTLAEHFNANGAYVVTKIEQAAAMDGTYTSNETVRLKYKNQFVCIPAALTYRPQRTTPRPVVRGAQTAKVVGPNGQEIFTDKYGRVKVLFPWDRSGARQADTSCWVRVAQVWAGQQWGGITIPRIGQEVIVAFEDGNPDQPIIVGSVYNSANMPPYVLPDNMTRSTFKTRSTLQGTAEMFNELRFEDKKDSEEIYFHAERDFNRVVEQNDTLKVGFEKGTDSLGNQSVEVYGAQTIRVQERDQSITLDKGNYLLTVTKGNRTVTVSEGNESHTVTKGNRSVKVSEGNQTLDVTKGNRSVTVGQGNDTHDVSQGNRTVTVAQGDDKLDVTAGKSSITAGTSIELKVGSNSIKIDAQGITIKAAKIEITADAKLDMKGTMASLSGDATLTLKGGLVQIN